MKAFKITKSGYGGENYIIAAEDLLTGLAEAELVAVLENGAVGEIVSFELVEISQEIYENSEEFSGW